MRAAEGGEEIIEGHFVGEIDGGEAKTPLVTVAAKEIVLADGNVEEIARSDARRIGVAIFAGGFRNLQKVGAVSIRGAKAG